MTNVVILSGNHLCHNPRVIKEADALARSGLEVTVLGAWLDRDLRERDQKLLEGISFKYKPVLDAVEQPSIFHIARVRKKISSIGAKVFRYESPWQVGYAYSALHRDAFDLEADLYIAHSELGMAVAHDLLASGRRVGIDMEDWFSEDLPPEVRRSRPLGLLRSYERELLRAGAYGSSPSSAMSAALAKEYDCSPPCVIYNAFAWAERQSIDRKSKDRRDQKNPSIHWFSQTLGPGRGLEELMAALNFLHHPAELHLRANFGSDEEAWVRNLLPEQWREHVFLHKLVSNEELLSRISEHDIGFAGEQTHCRSRDLTVTNKILYYLLGGLAVVATDTEGQREVAGKAMGAIALYPPGDAGRLAKEMDQLLSSVERRSQAKAAALLASEALFCWERQETKLLEAFGQALRSPSSKNC